MARLEIDIVGNNTELKKILADSKIALSEFSKSVSGTALADGLKVARVETQNARTEAVKLASTINTSLAESLNNAKVRTEGAKKATEDYKQSVLAAKTSVEQGKQAITDSNVALKNQQIETERSKTATQQARQAITELTLANKKAKNEIDVATGSYRQAQMQLTAMGKAIREAGNGFDLTNPKVKQAVAEYNALNNKLKEFDKAMGNNQRNVGNYKSTIDGIGNSIAQYASLATLAMFAQNQLNKAFQTNLQLDAMKTALKNISGDTQNFGKNMDFLRATSERLGLEFMSTANAFKMWQGAAKFSNLTADESRKIFESVANASAKMKLSSDQTQGAFLALSQMMSKGKVQAEELRGQLGERLPGAFALAAKAMGVTEMELNKMLETGQVVAQDFLPKFAAQLDKSFGNDKTEKIESMQASVNRLSNALTEMYESEGATNFFTVSIDGMTKLTKSFNDFISSKGFSGFMNAFQLIGSPSSAIGGIIGTAIVGKDKPAYTGNQLSLKDLGVNVSEFSLFTSAIDANSEAVIRNKQYWDEQVKSIRGSMEAMDSSMVGSAKYLELQNQLNIAEKQSNAYKAITKTQLNDINRKQEEYNKAISDVTKGALNQYDQKLFDITDKYNKLYNIIGKKTEKGLLAQQSEEAEKLRLRAEKLEDVFKRIKSMKIDLKPSDLKNASSINISDALPNLDWNKWGIDNRRGVPTFNDDTTALEKRLGKVVERGMRNGIDDIFGDIDNLGSNFYEVFSNVFGKLSKSVTSMLQSVLATQLGDLLSAKINDKDFSIAGLDAGKSKALIAGIGTAGSLISGLTSKKSVAGQALGGAASGAAAGLAFGPYGAAVGAVIGGLAGMFSAQQANKQSKIQEEMLKEQRKQTALQERANALAYTASIIGQQTTAGIVTGVDRNAFGEITFRVGGRDLVAVLGNEENAQKRGL